MLGEPLKSERLKLQKRIRVVRAWKRQTGGEPFPEWMDLDEMAAGTGDIGNGIPDQDSVSYYQRQRPRFGGQKLTQAQKQRSVDEHRVRMALYSKDKNGGIIGLVLTANLRVKCSYRGKSGGFYMTYREAAAVYDRLAKEHEGAAAILNDPKAVEREDKALAAEQKRRNVKTLRRRKKVRA